VHVSASFYAGVRRRGDKESVTAAFERYQQALRQLSADIDKRNKQRERPFQTFNPTLLNVSVST